MSHSILLSESLRKSRNCSRGIAFSGQFGHTKGIEKIRQKQPEAIVEYIALLSVKHSIYPAEFFQVLVSARENGKELCQTLAVEYRGSVKKEAIFLVTKGTAVIGQFRVAEDLLLRKNIRFDRWMNTEKIRKKMETQKRGLKLSTVIQNLRHGMKKVNVEAEVLETPTPSRVYTQFGNSATVTNALIGDETGKVRLCLWNEQVNLVNEGDTVQIKNATVSTYKGERQLRLGKSGTVNILSHAK